MPTFYERMRDGVGKNLLTKFKQGTVVINEISKFVGANAGDDPSEVVTNHTVMATATGFSDRVIDGVNIRAEDKLVTVSASGLSYVPKAKDRLNIDGLPYTIMSVKAVPASGTVIVYKIHARTAG